MKNFALLSLAVLVVSSLSGVASASEAATVRSRTADLRAEPSREGKARVKLGAGREVSIVAKSGDGEWVRVQTEITHADETIRFEGWLAAADLGLSGGSSAPVESAAAPKKDDLAWVDDSAPAAAPAADAPVGDNSWDSTPASAPATKTNEAPAKDEWSSSASDSGSAASSDSAAGW